MYNEELEQQVDDNAGSHDFVENAATVPITTISYDDFDFNVIQHGAITREDFEQLKMYYPKLFACILGTHKVATLFMFTPLPWKMFKEIGLEQGNDKDIIHEYILEKCIVSPRLDKVAILNMDAGSILTLVTQILAVSGFVNDPEIALQLIIPVKI